MIIDFHTHIFSPDIICRREYFLSDAAFSLLYAENQSRMADHSDLLLYMDENFIDHAVAMSFPWHTQKFCNLHNEYMAATMKQHSGRVSCFGMVAVNSGRDQVKQQVREIKSAGLAGIGELGFYAEGFTPENAEFTRHVLEAAGTESLPVCLHINEPVGHMYSGKYQPRLDELYIILKEFRDVKVILSHWGGGLFVYELMPEVKDSLKNVWYDTAATPYLYSPGIYDCSIAAAGAGKILFGSDFPLLGIKRYTEALNKQDAAVREMIMYSNAATILGLK
ncbi:MAG TPA: amidohydrolase family protein [Spirochaetota bacterium]|nr:amidohydrolase family protein [Spirochaetota bacterium]